MSQRHYLKKLSIMYKLMNYQVMKMKIGMNMIDTLNLTH